MKRPALENKRVAVLGMAFLITMNYQLILIIVVIIFLVIVPSTGSWSRTMKRQLIL